MDTPAADAPPTLEDTVNRTIHRLRNRVGAEQADLARKLGTTPGAVSHRLLGATRWRINDLPPVAEFFGVRVIDLLTEYEEIDEDRLPKAMEGRA